MEPLGRRAGRDPTFMIACEDLVSNLFVPSFLTHVPSLPPLFKARRSLSPSHTNEQPNSRPAQFQAGKLLMGPA